MVPYNVCDNFQKHLWNIMYLLEKEFSKSYGQLIVLYLKLLKTMFTTFESYFIWSAITFDEFKTLINLSRSLLNQNSLKT